MPSKKPAGSFVEECASLAREQRLRVDVMLREELDPALAVEVEAVLRDPSVPAYRVHRALAARGIACSGSAIGKWRVRERVIR